MSRLRRLVRRFRLHPLEPAGGIPPDYLDAYDEGRPRK